MSECALFCPKLCKGPRHPDPVFYIVALRAPPGLTLPSDLLPSSPPPTPEPSTPLSLLHRPAQASSQVLPRHAPVLGSFLSLETSSPRCSSGHCSNTTSYWPEIVTSPSPLPTPSNDSPEPLPSSSPTPIALNIFSHFCRTHLLMYILFVAGPFLLECKLLVRDGFCFIH